jgi:hypothetical protein
MQLCNSELCYVNASHFSAGSIAEFIAIIAKMPDAHILRICVFILRFLMNVLSSATQATEFEC